jgi:hypothetical protein
MDLGIAYTQRWTGPDMADILVGHPGASQRQLFYRIFGS